MGKMVVERKEKKMKKKIKLIMLFMMIILPTTANAKSIFSSKCEITLTEKQAEAAMAMDFTNDIEQVSCSTMNFVKTLKSETIEYKFEQLANQENSRAVEQYNGVYNMILSSQNDAGKYVIVNTMMCDSADCIYSKGKWQYMGTTWVSGTSVYSVSNEGYYTKSGNVITLTSSQLNSAVSINQQNNSHDGLMSAFYMPTGNITDYMYRFYITFNSQPSTACLGYYYIKPSIGQNILPTTAQWYMRTKGVFYWNNNSTYTNNYFYSNQLCL